ncbi:dehydrodolichyl diphosphate synthase complex subunit NUS1 [Cimex lectularius]|uniref:ditrans,polycis-polyprenyl diphosphate synthase [(2E,6E)-farnesyldiphosphate specific] n=1 Tax=Cimex lectularius TaxID=79782 RepID=A0A8I6RGE7_CIMLE|nr:dehydrodolichyl diphosphate synthase complex subunit NUS1 [Cimex lectularius]
MHRLSRCGGRLLLGLLHFGFALFLALGRLIRPLLRRPGLLHLQEAAFGKVPSHLALILGPEEASYDDMVKLIAWSFPVGIKHLSLYDPKNGIEAEKLFENVRKSGRQYIPKIKWGNSFSEEIKNQSKKSINGYRWNPTLTVHIYKREDGLPRIVETAKELFSAGCMSVDREILGMKLQGSLAAPDPDLAVICGDTLCYYAFPPWHLRITQMLTLETHHNFTANQFVQLLKDYCKCEQRYGK